MRFVIDGYNLMHALGMAPTAGLTLDRSRARFVEWLAVESGNRSGQLTLVFDSNRSSLGVRQSIRGIAIVFANSRTADDVIEEWIASEHTPATLTIVSNDQRLCAAALRRGCISWTCGEFVDWLQRGDPQMTRSSSSSDLEKPNAPDSDELDEWLERFES